MLAWADGNRKAVEEREERTNREAGDLLKVALGDRIGAPQPCLYDIQWSTRPVDALLARKYLDSKLHADLLAPHTGKAPADIIDPAGTMRQNFCSGVEADRLWKQRQADFRSGLIPDETEEHRRYPFLSWTRIEVSMPVFDIAFATAVVSVAYFTETMLRTNQEQAKAYPGKYDAAGYSLRAWPEGFGYSVVYRKQKGKWERIHTNTDFTMN